MFKSLVRTSCSENNNNVRQQWLFFNVLYVYGHNCVTSVCVVIISLVHLTDTFIVNIEISYSVFKNISIFIVQMINSDKDRKFDTIFHINIQ